MAKRVRVTCRTTAIMSCGFLSHMAQDFNPEIRQPRKKAGRTVGGLVDREGPYAQQVGHRPVRRTPPPRWPAHSVHRRFVSHRGGVRRQDVGLQQPASFEPKGPLVFIQAVSRRRLLFGRQDDACFPERPFSPADCAAPLLAIRLLAWNARTMPSRAIIAHAHPIQSPTTA